MEDILASIKRVIAEDARPNPLRAAPSASRDADDADFEDILELDQPVTPPTSAAPAAARDASLVSENAAEASRNSLAALAALRAPQPVQAPADGGPLEAVVRDMLRPMLKEWLDQRLPAIVEDLVAKEVARITGKG